jgi:hypothetical protein
LKKALLENQCGFGIAFSLELHNLQNLPSAIAEMKKICTKLNDGFISTLPIRTFFN